MRAGCAAHAYGGGASHLQDTRFSCNWFTTVVLRQLIGGSNCELVIEAAFLGLVQGMEMVNGKILNAHGTGHG